MLADVRTRGYPLAPPRRFCLNPNCGSRGCHYGGLVMQEMAPGLLADGRVLVKINKATHSARSHVVLRIQPRFGAFSDAI